MEPLNFENAAEMNCVANLTLRNFKFPFFCSIQYFSKALRWKLNYNYWTAGMKNSCNSTFSWCLSANTEKIIQLSNNLAWDKNQPDILGGNETCLHLKILKTGGLKLTDKNCASKFIVACKVFCFSFRIYKS
jgi:hypothetical protein